MYNSGTQSASLNSISEILSKNKEWNSVNTHKIFSTNLAISMELTKPNQKLNLLRCKEMQVGIIKRLIIKKFPNKIRNLMISPPSDKSHICRYCQKQIACLIKHLRLIYLFLILFHYI